MKAQVFIASYAKDAVWLRHSLLSLKKFSVGFLPPVVCVSQADLAQFQQIAAETFPEAEIKVYDGNAFMRAQIAMMRADELCPDADYIFLFGSDCFVTDTFTPEPFFDSGRPVMLYNTYTHLLQHHVGVMPWKRGTERVLGFPTPLETMRRIPLQYDRRNYAPMRAHVEKVHGMGFDDYIYSADKIHKNTSESNILGSYAYEFMPELYSWWNMDNNYNESMTRWPSPVIQFWSHAGIDAKCDRDYRYGDGKTTLGKTARTVFKEVLGDA